MFLCLINISSIDKMGLVSSLNPVRVCLHLSCLISGVYFGFVTLYVVVIISAKVNVVTTGRDTVFAHYVRRSFCVCT